ncbi:MAG: restriction endonuclease subunit S [Cyclobacteriaceae bacterium]
MEVRSGYKQTELGLIPNDWGIDYVKNLAVIKTGSKNTQDRRENGIYPFFVRSQTVEKINSYSYDGEAVLTAGDGVGVGKVIHYIKGKFDCHQRVYRISDFNSKLNGYYFYLYFGSNFLNRIMQMTAKSSVDSVRMDMIADMAIPIPSTLQEQTAIAAALSDTDALITSLEKLIAKKHNIKQGAMQELLSPKKGWELKTLKDVCEMSSGGTPLTSNRSYYDGGIPWVVIADISKTGKYISKTEKTISLEGLKNSSAKLFNKGVLLFAMYASIGKTTIALVDLTCNQAILGIYAMSVEIEFLYYFLSYNEKKFSTMGQTGTQSNLSKDLVEKIEIPIPVRDEQIRIATILADLDEEIVSLECKLEKYRQIKSGMMQNLLTGKIRLV